MIQIAPSVLSANFAHLGDDVAQMAIGGARMVHVDVMDGRFVPNITMGPLVVDALHRSTMLPLDVHLMIIEPEHYIPAFAQAGATTLIVHWEACPHLHRVIALIKENGCRAGVAMNPATPISLLADILPDLDQLLVMTVNPGFGGQHFIPHTLQKVAQARSAIDALHSPCVLEVDGGVDSETIGPLVQAGARAFVAGTSVFRHPQGIAAGVAALRQAADMALSAL